ncbi:cellulase family glycosylhydrolase [Dactylosporangium roseum]|uniref:cellulase n=1 Tax=Dactylosporangium roseum TaxID=47989 RepID=A0ABY5Z081_9ACTN|nr:glycoside hydrolase family 5 protein [Dactylosporangium roseum]UWZ35408.1 cellulase family glycosylhydrolase [Dactylosporangium roseum]
MVTRLAVKMAFPALLLSLLGAAYVSPSPAYGATGIKAVGGTLVEAGGEPLVLRGVNHGYAFGRGPASVFDDIKAAGANSVRVSLSSGHKWAATTPGEVASVIARCKAARLICVLDVHDTMGWGTESGAATISEAVDYWLGLKKVLLRQESYVIINLANEPSGHAINADWVDNTKLAIKRLRAAGLLHAIMADAPNWGNDSFHVMYDHAAEVFDSDPEHNVIFDVHMYGPFNTADKVSAYLDAFVRRRLPIVVGEFSMIHQYGDPDEDAIMAYCAAHNLGYLGWSWSGNSPEYHYLDVVSGFRPGRETVWGHRLIDGPDGLRATAREAGVYGGFWRAARR